MKEKPPKAPKQLTVEYVRRLAAWLKRNNPDRDVIYLAVDMRKLGGFTNFYKN